MSPVVDVSPVAGSFAEVVVGFFYCYSASGQAYQAEAAGMSPSVLCFENLLPLR